MLIFVSGHYPIYGTQILYFADKTLAERSAIPPPQTFVAIESGKIVDQTPDGRTRNVISAAEPSTPAELLSPMERAFLIELERRHQHAKESN